MPVVDDFHGRPRAGEGDPDPYAVERDLLAMPALPWGPILATVFALALGFGVVHAILLAGKEESKLVSRTLALKAERERSSAAAPAAPAGAEAVRVPEGPFRMGRPEGDEDANPDATPVHQVYLPAFYIGREEVTNAQYGDFVREAGYIPPPHWKGKTRPPEGIANLPVTYVSAEQAAAYAEWRGGRLCTEAEWEKAARGTDERIYPYGDTYDPNKANTDYGREGLAPVGSYPEGASPYGVLDLSGNVYEWTASRYTQYPGNSDDPARYLAYTVNEAGDVVPDPNRDSYYVVTRGGCWKCDPWSSQVTARNPTRPDYASDFFGIRVCWDAPPDTPTDAVAAGP
jgi:formylglycine-generating enzyme required for sulfatase activity